MHGRWLIAAGLMGVSTDHGEGAPAGTPCDAQAEVFVATNSPWQLTESLAIALVGPNGANDFSFLSGTTISNVIDAINTASLATGVQAESSSNPGRMRLHSVAAGASDFVSAQQIGGEMPRIFPLADGGRAEWMLIAHGADGMPGDADCDGSVDAVDLEAVIRNWGACSAPVRPCLGDLDLNTSVNTDDLLLVIANWGSSNR